MSCPQFCIAAFCIVSWRINMMMMMMMMMKDEYTRVFLQKSFGFYWHMSQLRILLCIMIKDEITCSTSCWSWRVLRDQVGHRPIGVVRRAFVTSTRSTPVDQQLMRIMHWPAMTAAGRQTDRESERQIEREREGDRQTSKRSWLRLLMPWRLPLVAGDCRVALTMPVEAHTLLNWSAPSIADQ